MMELSVAETISLIANVAEITALILVLATVYLISQEIKETRRIYTANAHSQIGVSAAAFLESIYKDPELQLLWSKGLTDSRLLNEQETVRFYLILLSYFTLLANGFYLSQVDSKITSRIVGMLDLMISRPSVRDWWQAGNYNPSPEFKAYVDERIEFLSQSGVIKEEVVEIDTEAERAPE